MGHFAVEHLSRLLVEPDFDVEHVGGDETFEGFGEIEFQIEIVGDIQLATYRLESLLHRLDRLDLNVLLNDIQTLLHLELIIGRNLLLQHILFGRLGKILPRAHLYRLAMQAFDQ